MVKLIKDRLTHVSQGFCFVYFENALVTIEALQMVYYGFQIEGKTVTVTYAKYP